MFVYVITNELTGKQYVGQTRRQDVRTRLRDHATGTFDSELTRAIAADGVECFTVKYAALPAGSSHELLDEIERRLIAHYGTRWPHGYNMQAGGAAKEQHPVTRERIAASKRGKPRSKETIEAVRLGMLASPKCRGWKCSEEQKKRLRECFSGKPTSDEQRTKLRDSWAKRKSSGWKKPPVTEEQRRRLSEALMGRAVTPEAREKIRAKLKGRPLSEETRAKMSASRKGRKPSDGWYKAMVGRKLSDETKAKISARKRERDAAKKLVAA